MKKKIALGTELSSEALAQVHGGRFYPHPATNFIAAAQELGKALGKATRSVGRAVKGAWDTISGLF